VIPALQQAIPAQRVHEELQRVLQREELEKGWIERVFEWLAANLSIDSGSAADFVLVLVLAPAGVAFAFVVVALLRMRRGRKHAEEELSPSVRLVVERRVSELLARARTARADGDPRLALRLAFFALVVGLGQRGDLRYRDAWTNRELLSRGAPSPEALVVLRPLLDEIEAKDFGGAPIEEGDVERLFALCDRWLGPSRPEERAA
jgi:hypothetical protein